MHETIFALSSGRPPAAIGIIRISGPAAFAAAKTLAGPLPDPRRASLRRLTDRDGALLDHALVIPFPGPATATGEDLVEFHCHGGRAVIDAVLTALAAHTGLRLAEPGEFTRRAFANGRIDLTEAEGLADLLAAENEAQRRAALAVADGGLRRQVETWHARLIDLSATAEAAIDYVGDEDETATDATALATAAFALAAEFVEWLARPRAEPLRDGITVAIAGPPNAGKSSLLNVLAGADKAIVTPIPGTTRDSIEVPLAIGGIPFRLIDTAGLRETGDPVEAIGVSRARQNAEAADILLWLGDGPPPDHSNLIRLHPRCDAPGRSFAPSGTLACSAVTGEGVAKLLESLHETSLRIVPPPDAIALNRRQADQLSAAKDALYLASQTELVLTAEALRSARSELARLTGYSEAETMLDALFGKFCLGK